MVTKDGDSSVGCAAPEGGGTLVRPATRKRALLGSNPPRNSRSETRGDAAGADGRGAARLNAALRRRQPGEELLHRAAPEPPPQHRLLILANPMNLKDMFGRVQTNPDNRHSDGSHWLLCQSSQPRTPDAVSWPSTPTFLAWAPAAWSLPGAGFAGVDRIFGAALVHRRRPKLNCADLGPLSVPTADIGGGANGDETLHHRA